MAYCCTYGVTVALRVMPQIICIQKGAITQKGKLLHYHALLIKIIIYAPLNASIS